MQAASSRTGVTVVFQPDLYCARVFFAERFAAALSGVQTILAGIYGAREDPEPGVDSTLTSSRARCYLRYRAPASGVLLTPEGGVCDDGRNNHCRALTFLTSGKRMEGYEGPPGTLAGASRHRRRGRRTRMSARPPPARVAWCAWKQREHNPREGTQRVRFGEGFGLSAGPVSAEARRVSVRRASVEPVRVERAARELGRGTHTVRRRTRRMTRGVLATSVAAAVTGLRCWAAKATDLCGRRERTRSARRMLLPRRIAEIRGDGCALVAAWMAGVLPPLFRLVDREYSGDRKGEDGTLATVDSLSASPFEGAAHAPGHAGGLACARGERGRQVGVEISFSAPTSPQ